MFILVINFSKKIRRPEVGIPTRVGIIYFKPCGIRTSVGFVVRFLKSEEEGDYVDPRSFFLAGFIQGPKHDSSLFCRNWIVSGGEGRRRTKS